MNPSINSASLPCPACKTANQVNARFCLNCGAALNSASQTPYQPPSSNQTPPLTLGFVYAGFWKRAIAYIIDAIIYSFFYILIAAFMLGMQGFASNDLSQIGLLYLGYYLGWWLYFSIMESSSGQATLGKRILGIKVTDIDGQPLSFILAASRQLAGLISSFTFSIGYLIAAFSGRKQALHDMIASTVVVNKNFDCQQIRAVNQAPPPGMSIGAIIGIVAIILVIPVGGILAAIAIPAYHQYTIRAKASEAYLRADSVKADIVKYASETGYWPSNFEQAGISSQSLQADHYHIQLQNNGVLRITFTEPLQISRASFDLIPDISDNGAYVWQCKALDIDPKYRPQPCR